jgi:hypothetical protein
LFIQRYRQISQRRLRFQQAGNNQRRHRTTTTTTTIHITIITGFTAAGLAADSGTSTSFICPDIVT